MTRKERVLNTFHNVPTDKILVGFWHHYLQDELVDGLHHPEYIEQNLAAAKQFKSEFNPDFVKVMTDGYFFFPFDYEKIQSASDLKNLKATADMDVYLDKSVEFAKATREIYGNDILMFYNIFSPSFQINQRIKQTHPELTKKTEEPIVTMLKENPEAVKVALELIGDYTERIIESIVGTGIADGIFFSVSCFNRGVDPETYNKYIAPVEKRIIDKANYYAKDNILHICGWRGNLNNLSIYTDYDMNVINWAAHAEGIDVATGKAMFGGKCVIGGFGNNKDDLLCSGTKEEIQEYVEQIANEAGTTGVIIGADCTIHLDTPDEHVHWVYEKADELSKKLLK